MTLFILDMCNQERQPTKTAFIYLLASIFCALFGAGYESCSHGVYSGYMIYAFAFPLIGGTLPFSSLQFVKKEKYPNSFSCSLYHYGIATFTVGSFVRGVLDIYGTSNSRAVYYWIAGMILMLISFAAYVMQFLPGYVLKQDPGHRI